MSEEIKTDKEKDEKVKNKGGLYSSMTVSKKGASLLVVICSIVFIALIVVAVVTK